LDGGNIDGEPGDVKVSVKKGESVGDKTPTPHKDEYTFGGWYTERNGGGNAFNDSTQVKEDITVFARWTITVTFDLQEGSIDGATEAQTRAVNSGDSLGTDMPSNPSRENHTFGGWYTAIGGGGVQFIDSTQVEENMTVYAKWTVVPQYTVTFDLQEGNIDGDSAQQTRQVYSGSSLGANMPSNPNKDEYTFGGWYTVINGGGSEFTDSTPVNEDMTVYAKWAIVQYTVAFDLQGGSISGDSAQQTRTVNKGDTLGANTPSNPSKGGYTFGGWYTAINGGGDAFTSSTQVNEDMTVYAKWTVAQIPSNLSLAASLAWISSNAIAGGDYTITIKSDETIAPQSLSYDGKKISITLEGGTAERWVILNANGSLFTVDDGVTLTLGNNVTLQGRSSNATSLVRVNSGGTLVIEDGLKLSGNTSSSAYGGGVYVSGGTFTMNGGTISGNTASAASNSSNPSVNSSSYGGGVFVYSGTFTMTGGEISGNTASASNSYPSSGYTASSYGGGVFVNAGTFMMIGGEISGNSASSSAYYASYAFSYGGGVYVSNSGTFIKQSGGTVYGSNTAPSGGRAVYVGTSPAKKRDSTAGSGVVLNSGISGSAGGWE
jgi:uncharacterized repeat protein (TIGR02543 family)